MNCAIYQHDSDKIEHFVLNCVKQGNDFIGSNCKKYGIKPTHWSVKWTDDVANPIFDEENQIGWDKKVSELNGIDDSIDIIKTTIDDVQEAVMIRRQLSTTTYKEIDQYVESNIIDLPSAKMYIKKLSKVVLAIIKMMDK